MSDSDTTGDERTEAEIAPLAAYDGALDIEYCNAENTLGLFDRGPKLPDQMAQFDTNLLIKALAHFQEHYGRIDVQIGLVEPSNDDGSPALALWVAGEEPDCGLIIAPKVRGGSA